MQESSPDRAIERAVKNVGSQQKLAEAIGVTQSLVSQWINGATVHQRHYEAIERVSGIRVHELLEDDLARLREVRLA